MIQEVNSLSEEIREIESVFMLLADYSKNIILADTIFNEISCVQYGILLYLDKQDRATVNDIVKSQKLSYPLSSQLLDELSKLNLINRNRSDEDRRLVFVSITEKGKEMIAEILYKRHTVLKQIFKDFKPAEMKLIMDSFSILKKKLITLKDN